ncbi:MAG: amidohydrolase [Verrucomicrobiaceae bacterium]|nr:amidohydrolase [Verrucomicrobiaceae bacterium]
MPTRRQFITAAASAVAGASVRAQEAAAEPVFDIHQHTHYHARETDEQLILHQKNMLGAGGRSILLPSGSPQNMPSTHMGRSNGLAAKTGGNAECMRVAKAYPDLFLFGANEVTDLPNARDEIEKYLKLGAVIIAEQKFAVECDSAENQKLYELAAAYRVPILLHFQHKTYNLGYDRFYKMLEKFPRTNFIGHAQCFWGNIDKNHDQTQNYPKGSVTPGGITDRYLSDYPNIFADMSAGSGLNALERDEEHTRGFLGRHQDKILYGSDCADLLGRGPGCQGAGTIAAIRRLSPDKKVERKILFENSKKLFRL